MASTYSNIKIQLMATGENSTTWGDVTNINLGTAIEEAIVGSADVTFASANVTLTLSNTNASQTARNMRLRCTGTTGGSTRNLVVPSIEKPYIVANDCADSILVKTAAGNGITVPAGKTMWVYSNGTDVVDVTTHLTSLTLATALPILSGGTGSNTASGARTNLGLGTIATQNANAVAITGGSITGITDLAIADGGTGASTAADARTNLGLGALAVLSSVNNSNWSGTALVVANGGTGATDAAGARTNLGLGSLAVLSSINNSNWSGTALSIANGGTGATDAATARSNLGAGTVTSVGGTGTVNGLTLTGTVTASGNLTLGGTLSGVSLTTQVTGTLPIANGGTNATTAGQALTNLGAYPASNPNGYTSNAGTVTSVSGTGTASGLTLSGTVTSSGNLTLSGTVNSLAAGTYGISISGNAATATTANALNTGNTYTAVGYVSTQTSGTALQVGDNSGIRNFSSTGQAVYIDVAGGGTTPGQIILRNTNAFTAMAIFGGSGTQLTSLGVGTAPSGTAGEIRATNNVTAYFSSDARLKENVADIQGALDAVTAIGGKTFDWTDAYIAQHGGSDGYFVRKSDFGVIAQDVEAVFPLAVRTREDGTLAVDYEKLVAVAFAAIAELRAEVNELRQQAVKVVK